MKALIVNPSRFYSGDWGGGQLQHLFTLYSYLRTHSPGVEVEVLDFESDLFKPDDDRGVADFLKLARGALETTGFDIVGISCWTSLHYLASVAVAEICKELNPQGTVVVGGYHPSSLPGDFAYRGSPFDYVVVGEGEVAFQRIAAGQIPKEVHPQVVQGAGVQMADVELLWDEYKYYRNADEVGLWLTRGCPFSCGFCLDRLTKWRGYSPARAVAELKRMTRALPRVKSVGFLDPIFGLNRTWRREFLDALLAADLGLAYWGETRADLLEEEDVKRLGALNFVMDVGLDAVAPRMIAIMMKSRHPDRYVRRFLQTDAWMNRYAVPHAVYGILNYPGETPETLKETLQFWTRYYQEHPGSHAVFSSQTFKFFPGCEVFNNWKHYEEAYGARVLHPEWWKLRRPAHSELSGQIVPSRELAEAGKLGYEKVVSRAITTLAAATVCDTAHEIMRTRLAPWAELQVADSYLDDKRLGSGMDSHCHKRPDTRIVLFNFDKGAQYACGPEESSWVEGLLEKDLTIGALCRREAEQHPEPERVRRNVKGFLRRMVTDGFLEVQVAPPPPGVQSAGTASVIHTPLGTMAFELLPGEAPRTVANFVHLARLGYYDGMLLSCAHPGVYVEMGAVVSRDRGPGYALAREPTPRAHRRGSLSMDIGRHTSRFTICRRAWPDLDGHQTVFGEMVAGWDVLDRLLKGDRVVQVEIRAAV
jgi:radical SAM superfamily enzyme YgiQ (UPF0313 family)/cyclophilin family peptidyl-prolyl cis-trans isomerase